MDYEDVYTAFYKGCYSEVANVLYKEIMFEKYSVGKECHKQVNTGRKKYYVYRRCFEN